MGVSFSEAAADVESPSKDARVGIEPSRGGQVRIDLSAGWSNIYRTLAGQNVIWLNVFVHAIVAQVEIALVHTTPEALVNAQIRNLARVAEDESIAILPACLASMRVKRVTVWTLNPDVGVVEPFKHLQVLKLLALILQELDAIVLLLLEIVGNLAVFTVDPGFCAGLNVRSDIAVADSLPALARDLSERTSRQVRNGIVVCQNILMTWVDGLAFLDEWTLEPLLLETLLRKPMNGQERGVRASDRTFLLIFDWLLLHPLVYAFATECSLALLALLGVKQDLETDLADEELLEGVTNCIAWTQIHLLAADFVVLGIVSFKNEVLEGRWPPLVVDVNLLSDVLEHVWLDQTRRLLVCEQIGRPLVGL